MRLEYADFQITENFNTKEFHCHDGSLVPNKFIANVVYVAQQLQTLRNLLGGCTVYINSAYRSYNYNRKVGGSPTSNHLTGNAVDICTQKYSAKELHSKIVDFIQYDYLPEGELILYPTFVHYAPKYSPKHNKIHYPIAFTHEML